MKKIFSAIAVLTAFAMVAVSCNDDDTKDDEKVPVTEIKVTPATGSVVAGTTLTLKAEVFPENASDKTIEWKSRTPDIAEVDPKTGVVTGLIEGDAEILALCGGKSGKATLTVTPAPIRVEKITLSKTDLPLFVGKTEKLTYTINPENATNQDAVWDSSNKAVATIADDGTVTALSEGTTDITLTIDEKTETCKVTVSIPEMESISTPYLKDLTGSSVKMTAAGFKAGDKVNLEDFFGYTGSADVKNVTAADATFDLPADAPKDRSLKITVMRDGKAICVDYIRYNSEMVKMPASLGYALTAKDEVVTDGSIAGFQGNLVRQGYVKPAAVFQYNATERTFDAAPVDLKLCTFTPAEGGIVNLSYVTGVKDLSGMKYFDLSGVKELTIANTLIEELDMTLFPNCLKLMAWGDPGMGNGRFKKVNFGTYGTDPTSKLTYIQLERNQIEGEIDMRQLPNIDRLSIQDNQVSGFNFGKCNDAVEKMCPIYELNAENNKITELSIENCGKIRILKLAGNLIERLTILNNSKQAGGMQWMYLFKAKDTFTLSWATKEQAQGRPRVFNVEKYWWREFSDGTANGSGNYDECLKGEFKFYGFADDQKPAGYEEAKNGWKESGPIALACKDGVEVICWTYHGEDGADSHPISGHDHTDGVPCN